MATSQILPMLSTKNWLVSNQKEMITDFGQGTSGGGGDAHGRKDYLSILYVYIWISYNHKVQVGIKFQKCRIPLIKYRIN